MEKLITLEHQFPTMKSLDSNKKASKIRISFKASTASSFSCSAGGDYLEIAGAKNEGDKYRIKLNAALRIDDVTLNY